MRINVFLRAAIGAAFGEFKDPIELLHILRKMKD